MRVPLSTCRYRLAILWLAGFFVLAGLLAIQHALGHYGEDADAAWGWLLPNVVPTLSLMVGVLVAAQRSKPPDRESVDRTFFRLSFLVSLAYLGFLLFTILVQPFATLAPLALMDGSKLYLGPFQGLATGMLAAFFMSATDETPKAG
ncbi:MAG TPA: hypothetical protein VFN28_10030 [Amaricoccus sp.]|jgi:hypothetical protein|nr:hypothetical protein [Amaricoccus sp.]